MKLFFKNTRTNTITLLSTGFFDDVSNTKMTVLIYTSEKLESLGKERYKSNQKLE